MKTIPGLDDKITLIEPKKTDSIPPTIKEVLLTEISMENSIRGPEAIRLNKIGIDIMGAGDKIDLEDADFNLLVKVLDTPKHIRGIPIGYSTTIIGFVQSIFKKAESGT